jgi:predicted kinase
LELAGLYAAPWLKPLVVAVGGLAGTGKTTLAMEIAKALGAELLRTDLIRQELFGTASDSAAVDDGIYRREARERVYDEMFRRAAGFHAHRLSVILDGTFSTRDLLNKAQQFAVDPHSGFLAIECICRPEIARQRIRQRLDEGRDASEATPEIYEIQHMRWESWGPDVPQIRIDTEQPLSRQLERMIVKLRSVVSGKAAAACPVESAP